MKRIYKANIWQSGSGHWEVNDTNDLTSVAGLWWVPCRILNLDPASYILLLKDKFNASYFHYSKDKNVLLFSWDNYDDAHAYQLFINRKARERNFLIDF